MLSRAFALVLFTAFSVVGSAAQTHVVISQVYGGGGNSGAQFTNDFIELYNPTSTAVDISGYSIQYAGSTGTSWNQFNLPTGATVQPGKFYLIKAAAGTTASASFTADFDISARTTSDDGMNFTINLSGTAGKVALVNNHTALSGTATTPTAPLVGTTCPATNVAAIVDFVGFGTAATCYEASPTPSPSNTSSVVRSATGADTDVNSVDFTTLTPPNPRYSGTTTIPVTPPATVVAISTLQTNRSTYVGTNVTTTGIVTLVTNAGFYLQTPSTSPGSTGSAEGLYVYAGTGKVPATAVVGSVIQVAGSLSLYPAATASHTPSLELSSPVVTTISTGQTLPTAIKLSAASLTPTGGIYQLTKYEGMLVTVPSLTAVSGTDGSLNESTETVTSSGEFYAVMTGVARPFREPGIDFRDFLATTCPTVTNCTATATALGVTRPANLVLFDDNPERLLIESSLGGGTPLDISAGAVVTNVTGVIDFSYATDVPYGDPARLILTPGTVTASNVTPGISVVPLAVPGANQFTIAAFNIERFYNTNAADDLYYNPATGKTAKSGAVDITQAAYTRRLQKVSLAIRTVLNNPDILSIEECENLSVLQDIVKHIDADTTTGTKPGYVAYGSDSLTTFTNDGTGISVGFLIKPATVDLVSFAQVGASTTFQTASGTAETLNDRPSDVLHAGIKRGAGVTDYPITVISNHLKALTGVNSLSPDTRTKKELQAEMVANLIQGYQAKGEHVVAVGDMNAFQFSDGYTDTLGTITGRTVDPTSVVQPGMANLVTPAATDLATLLPAAQQQSYTEFGDAQILDHVVVTADIVGSTTLSYAHLDADFPLVSYNDATTPARVSDHDAALAYLALPAPVISGTFTGTGAFPSEPIGTGSNGQVFTLSNTGQAPLAISAISATGDFAQSNTCGSALAVGSTCSVNVVFKPTASGTRSGTLTVSSNATISALSLSGTGILPDFSIAGSGGTTSATVNAGASAALSLVLTPMNTFTGTVTLSCVPVGTAPTGVTCAVSAPTALSSAPATVTVTFSTTARTLAAGISGLPRGGVFRLVYLALLFVALAAAFAVRRSGRALRWGGLLALTFAVLSCVAGCSGSGQTSNPNGTAAGTYSYTVTATSGTLTHTQTVTLTVN